MVRGLRKKVTYRGYKNKIKHNTQGINFIHDMTDDIFLLCEQNQICNQNLVPKNLNFVRLSKSRLFYIIWLTTF